MTKIKTGLAGMIVVVAMAMQPIASAQEPPKKPVPAAKPAPVAKPAPAPPPHPAPAARIVAPPARPAPAATAAPAHVVGPKVFNPAAGPAATGAAAPNTFTRSRGPTAGSPGSGSTVRANSIRGASRTTIAGQNFSIRRGSYRVRRGDHWRTFVGPTALAAILFGAAYYYPYAYIDVSDEYCDGMTEDGCQLHWMSVPTYEGPSDFQCVAYCPWQ